MRVQEENGVVCNGISGEFVAADLVAKLAGVSLSQVRKVFAAMCIVAREQDVDMAELADYFNTPQALPDALRASNTQHVFDDIRSYAQEEEIKQLLNALGF